MSSEDVRKKVKSISLSMEMTEEDGTHHKLFITDAGGEDVVFDLVEGLDVDAESEGGIIRRARLNGRKRLNFSINNLVLEEGQQYTYLCTKSLED